MKRNIVKPVGGCYNTHPKTSQRLSSTAHQSSLPQQLKCRIHRRPLAGPEGLVRRSAPEVVRARDSMMDSSRSTLDFALSRTKCLQSDVLGAIADSESLPPTVGLTVEVPRRRCATGRPESVRDPKVPLRSSHSHHHHWAER